MPIPDKWDETVFEEFVYWVHERQKIYKKRFIENKDQPWTDDNILQHKHFTNVFRRLDRVTKFYIDNYVDQNYDKRTVFLNTVIFRLINEPETMDLFGVINYENYSPEKVYDPVIKAEKNNEIDRTFNNAYITAGNVEKGEKKIESFSKKIFQEIVDNMSYYFDDNFEDVSKDSLQPINLVEEFNNRLVSVKGIGDFLAYEIYTDMTYHDWFPWDENDFVNVGPGAKRFIQRLHGKTDPDPSKSVDYNYEQELKKIYELKEEWLSDEIYIPEECEVTLRTIEHSCCEVDKYLRSKNSENSSLRNFEPKK